MLPRTDLNDHSLPHQTKEHKSGGVELKNRLLAIAGDKEEAAVVTRSHEC